MKCHCFCNAPRRLDSFSRLLYGKVGAVMGSLVWRGAGSCMQEPAFWICLGRLYVVRSTLRHVQSRATRDGGPQEIFASSLTSFFRP